MLVQGQGQGQGQVQGQNKMTYLAEAKEKLSSFRNIRNLTHDSCVQSTVDDFTSSGADDSATTTIPNAATR